MKIMKKLQVMGLVIMSAVALVVVPATAAHAATGECTVFYATTTCTTETIRANASGHYVDVFAGESFPANPICNAGSIRWKVVDADNGVVVRRGSGDTRLRITGLYGRYYARLDTCPRMLIRIDNV